jgi:hypothetical protein
MTYTEIYIDDASIDLGQGELSCPITYSLIDIKNLNNRSGSRTKTVSVPRTVKNDRIFGVAFDVNATNRFDKYVPHRVIIEEGTEVIFDGLCKLANVTPSKIDFFCYGELSAFKGISGTSTLQDLRLNDLDHTYDTTIYDTWDGIYPTYVEADYIYPVIDYGTFWTRALDTPEETDIFVVDLFPAVFLERIIRQICLDNGYTLVTSFFNDPQMAKLCIPFTNKDFVHSEGYMTETKGFEGYTNSNSPYALPNPIASYNLPIVTEVFDPLDQWHQANREYTADSAQRASVRFRGFIDFTGGGHNTSDIVFNFIVEKYTALSLTWSSVATYPMSFTGAIQYVDWTNSVNLASGDKIRFRLERLVLGTGTKLVSIYAENVQITPQPVTGITILEGETVQLAPNLPPIKQIDLMSWCYKMFNWVIDVDAKQGVLYIDTYDTYYNTPDVIDMSRKLNLSTEPVIGYDDTDFARKYDFRYTLDEADYYLKLQTGLDIAATGLDFGNGKLYLTEQGDAQLIGPVGFSPTVINKSFSAGLEIPCMITADGGTASAPVFSTDHEPRIMIYAGNIDVAVLSDSAYSEVITDDGAKSSIPFVYFQKRTYGSTLIDAFTQNLSFDLNATSNLASAVVWSPGTLIDAYYLRALQDLSTSARVTAYFNLTPADLSSLDFGTRWYVDFFEAQFKLNRILDYQPGRMSPTKVELVKVGAYVNPRSLDTLE